MTSRGTDESLGSLTASDLLEAPKLRAYLANVRDWHGYIRFLGLPDRRDNPDILIDRLFVEPLLTRHHISPNEDPASWIQEAETIFDAMELNKPLVLLGDPGSGKSTLLNYLVWLLSRPTGELWRERLGDWILPVPMVLRELKLRSVTTFPALLKAFMNHPICESLRNSNLIETMIEEGRALIFLDGIDETGDPDLRRGLRSAVLEGIERYPDCRWLLSSRIVGYDEVPFDSLQANKVFEIELEDSSVLRAREQTESHHLPHMSLAILQDARKKYGDASVLTRFIAPFDDKRISAFAKNWYAQREAAAKRAGEDAEHLVRAVHADTAILQLARVPNLLTMMALIHRVEATLPHGRALLYERIAEAYLESIDRYRGVYSGAYNFPQKKRWLARVGYEMQRKRSATQSPGGTSQTDLLVDRSEVLGWINAEMSLGVDSSETMSAVEFLDFVGRRSGLFLPRGEGRYAFVHLSFQEYFAAVAIEREVTGITWAQGRRTSLGIDRSTMAKWANETIWCETLSFLFELLSSKEDWHEELLKAVFGMDFSTFNSSGDAFEVEALSVLLARLVVNQRSGLAKGDRLKGMRCAIKAELNRSRHFPGRIASTGVYGILMGYEELGQDTVLKTIVDEASENQAECLDLSKTRIANIDELGRLGGLRLLNLRGTEVSDLDSLSHMQKLETLVLWDTPVKDVEPLRKLTKLRWLNLWGTGVEDVSAMAELKELSYLNLAYTKVSNIEVLSVLQCLNDLTISSTEIDEFGVLGKFQALRSLNLWSTRVKCLEWLGELEHLENLDLWGTEISEVGILSKLKCLKELDLGNTAVSNIESLASVSKLKRCILTGTNVESIGPMSNLTALMQLDLQYTRVSDVRPLFMCRGLRWINIKKTAVPSSMVRDLRAALPNCNVLFEEGNGG